MIMPPDDNTISRGAQEPTAARSRPSRNGRPVLHEYTITDSFILCVLPPYITVEPGVVALLGLPAFLFLPPGVGLRADGQHFVHDHFHASGARLAEIAAQRGQKLSQLALSWVLRDSVVTSALIGASRPEQITENVQAVHAEPFTEEQLKQIDEILAG